jgi:hypothetical protein
MINNLKDDKQHDDKTSFLNDNEVATNGQAKYYDDSNVIIIIIWLYKFYLILKKNLCYHRMMKLRKTKKAKKVSYFPIHLLFFKRTY